MTEEKHPYYDGIGWQARKVLVFLATHKNHVFKNRQIDKVLHGEVPDDSSLCSTWQIIARLEKLNLVKQRLEMLTAIRPFSLSNKPYKVGWVVTEGGEKYALELIEERLRKHKRGRPRKVSVPA